MSANTAWTRRSLAAVWHPCTQMKLHDPAGAAVPLLPIARAQGAWLEDMEGRRYLDGISSWWVNLFGHNHPAIRDALQDQLGRLDHVMLAGFTHAPVVELSERLGGLTGLGHAFYGSDGASATEIALKMSAHHWRNGGHPEKCQFVGLAGGYHGETVGALGVTDVPLFRDAYAPLLRWAATLPSPDARAALPGESAAEVAARAADAAEAWLAEHHAQTAAFIMEPLVQCAAGMAMHHPEYLRRIRAACRRWQVHLVLDEIAVGFGRTGTLFAHQQADIRPDFLCLSKGLTGGTLPLSVVMCTDEVYQAFWDDSAARGFLHSHSYTGNPLACRAALATLDLFEQTQALAHSAAFAERLRQALAPLSAHPRVRHARQQGSILAWDVPNRLPDFARRFARHALAHGAVLRPIGHTVYLMPPYILQDDEIQHLAQAALAALNATLADEADADVALPLGVGGAMASEAAWGLFVAGTDTGVGKTRVSAALLRALAQHHRRVVGMKPVAAGLVMHQGQAVSEDVLALRAASTVEVPPAWDNPVALPEPLSPHLAAARCGQPLSLPPLLQAWQHLRAQADVVVVEGAGGWLAPLNDSETMASLAQALALPVVLVVGLRLGCLNHALLTARAIQADGLSLAGWVANTVDPNMACVADNVATLRARLPAPLLGVLPWQPEVDADPACLQLPLTWT